MVLIITKSFYILLGAIPDINLYHVPISSHSHKYKQFTETKVYCILESSTFILKYEVMVSKVDDTHTILEIQTKFNLKDKMMNFLNFFDSHLVNSFNSQALKMLKIEIDTQEQKRKDFIT